MTQLSLLSPPRRPRVSPVVREQVRRESNTTRVLARLQQGPATNVELATLGGLRFGGRVHELRHSGYAITVTDLGGGLFRYALESEKSA